MKKPTDVRRTLIKTSLPDGLILTEDGYKVIRLNGDIATGFVGSDCRYYEQVKHITGRITWFTDIPALEEQ